uniref:uncharacterized protein LOC120330273 n=1 Tax=Styela clava TaxID=7725 RepID=UPI00193A3302
MDLYCLRWMVLSLVARICHPNSDFNFSIYYEEQEDQDMWAIGLPFLNITSTTIAPSISAHFGTLTPTLKLQPGGLLQGTGIFYSSRDPNITCTLNTQAESESIDFVSCNFENTTNLLTISLSLPKLEARFNESVFYFELGSWGTSDMSDDVNIFVS